MLSVQKLASALGLQYPAPSTCTGIKADGLPCNSPIYAIEQEKIICQITRVTANIQSAASVKHELDALADISLCRYHKSQKTERLQKWTEKIGELRRQQETTNNNASYMHPSLTSSRHASGRQRDSTYKSDAPLKFGLPESKHTNMQGSIQKRDSASRSLVNRLVRDRYTRRPSYQENIPPSIRAHRVLRFDLPSPSNSGDSYVPDEDSSTDDTMSSDDEVVLTKRKGARLESRDDQFWWRRGVVALGVLIALVLACIAEVLWFPSPGHFLVTWFLLVCITLIEW